MNDILDTVMSYPNPLRVVQAILDQCDMTLEIQNKVADLIDMPRLKYGGGYELPEGE